MIKSMFSRNLINILGYKINQKIVIIESDDWGSIRMANADAYKELSFKGYPVNQSPYNKFDALESNEDLIQLINVLNSVKGADENPAKFTINNIVANPDFEKIEVSNFSEYFWEPFTKTLERYPMHNNVMDLYKKGIELGVFKPQFHGREHLNVDRWLKSLRKNDKATIDAFNLKIFSPSISNSTNYTNEFMDAFDYDSVDNLKYQEIIISEGLDLFEQIWGYKSKSFIAPCYIWDSSLETILASKGVNYIQGMVNQFNPIDEKGFQYKLKYHFQGQRNRNGQRYLIRNAFFEPAINPSFAWEQDCLNRIQIAFKWKKPAIISSHRLNYIGFLNPKNREINLKRLKYLLESIIKKWPEVIFISSDELGYLMNEEN